ncbi:hypothetical protein C8Q77DRAFT_1045880 [Trametes polyzona]|nr:hypothetical protein C8Q77DRAFT_1045880 [Trametes polyzona]
MRPCAYAPFWFFALFSAFATSPLARVFASAALVNVTIDDTLGDESNGNQIIYDPPGSWNVGQDCPGCTAQLDRSLVRYGTWHDSTYNDTRDNDPAVVLETAAAKFEGVAVYVFCVVTRSLSSPTGTSDMSFYIDGELVGRFIQIANGDATYHYNVPVYVNESLPDGPHTIAIVNGQRGSDKSLVLLDYIVYTHQEAESISTSPPPSTAAQAGASASPASVTSPPLVAANSGSVNSSQKRTIVIAVASVCSVLGAAVIIIIATYCCIRKRRGKYNTPSDRDVIPRSPSHIEVNPATSGWAEGTWAPDQEGHPPSSFHGSPSTRLAGMLSPGQRQLSTKRKRSGSDTQTPVTPLSSTTASPTRSPIVPPAILSALPAFRFSPSAGRSDPPGSPASSSWGTPASMAPPDSATYLIQAHMQPSNSHVYSGRAYQDVGDSSTTLSSHNAHPFAKAQAAESAPLGRSRSGTTRSAANANSPPSAMPHSFATHTRGYSSEKERAHRPADPLPSGSISSPSTPPSAPYTLDTDESFLPSPSPADPSPLSSFQAQTRVPSQSRRQRYQLQDQQSQQHRQQQLRPSASQRTRRVDPVDPSLLPSRDPPTRSGSVPARTPPGPRARPSLREARGQGQATPQPERTGPTSFQRDRRRRYGTVDVPVDAAEGSDRPPSYHIDV